VPGIRYLAAGLLCVTGVIHVARLGIPDSTAVFDWLVSILGAAYLTIGGFLFRGGRTACSLGAIVPVVGILVGAAGGISGMMAKPNLWMAVLFAIDVAIVACCFSLVRSGRTS